MSSSTLSDDIVIHALNVGKAYNIYEHYEDRMKQALFGRFRDFHRKYWALRDVTLDIRRGECVGFVGRNGSGKTTFLQMVCGITAPTSGDLRVRGNIAPILALGATFDLDLTGRQNAFVSGAILGVGRKTLEARMEAIADFSGLGDFFDQPVKFYSSGMQARVAFAVCTQADPTILVVDEALAVGDAAFQKKCFDFIHDFRKRGTLLFVSHSTALTREICDRAVYIDRGAVRMQGDPATVCAAYEEDVLNAEDSSARFEFA